MFAIGFDNFYTKQLIVSCFKFNGKFVVVLRRLVMIAKHIVLCIIDEL